MFAPPPVRPTRVFARLPDRMRKSGARLVGSGSLFGTPIDSFLEGPSFDRAGTLHLVDIANGRVLAVSPAGEWRIVAEYEGEPNGLKFHKDGRVFICDHKNGLMLLDTATGRVAAFLDRPRHERFRGLNDLVFARNGDLYFTDQGQSGLHDPTGRLFRLRADGRLDLLVANVPSPNGVALAPEEDVLYLAVTRANAVWRVPLFSDGSVGRVGAFIQLSGSLGGPDGLAVDEAGNLAVAHHGLGVVWLFSRLGEPIHRVQSAAGLATTNMAYGGPERRTLYITESQTGSVLAADMDVPGLTLFSHRD